jgi:hypothetical protein
MRKRAAAALALWALIGGFLLASVHIGPEVTQFGTAGIAPCWVTYGHGVSPSTADYDAWRGLHIHCVSSDDR